MKKVFLGGSRNVTRLNKHIRSRLDNIIEKQIPVVVGDANGADKALQTYLSSKQYANVEVFCSEGSCRNNVGRWRVRAIPAGSRSRGFSFYTAKDRAMAQEADLGFMVWDGKSTGTLVNVYLLLSDHKIAVLYSVPDKRFCELRTADDWRDFAAAWPEAIRQKVDERLRALDVKGYGTMTQLALLERTGSIVEPLPEHPS